MTTSMKMITQGQKISSEDPGVHPKAAATHTIRFGIDSEIDKALKTYFSDEQRLSKVYWPKVLRILLKHILEFLLTKSELWKKLSVVDFPINEETLTGLIKELQLATSHRIKVKQRRWFSHVLRELSMYRKSMGLSARRPTPPRAAHGTWPDDIEDKGDLSSSLTEMSLREDVKDFLWEMLDNLIPGKYCNMHYFGAIPSQPYPIVVEVNEGDADRVTQGILAISDELKCSQQVESLLPSDVVHVLGAPARDLADPKEEGLITTSGSPWKDGTVGGILKCGAMFFGITSAHVDAKSQGEYDDLCTERTSLTRFRDNYVDVAFFTFANGHQDFMFNMFALKYMDSVEDLKLEIGETIHKMGRSTGYTRGRLGSIQSNLRVAGGFRYDEHVQVLWNNDGFNFAFAMDCGSLYCVERDGWYIPIAIHRISDDSCASGKTSYGCSIWRAMEFFPELSDSSEHLEFSNAMQSARKA